MKQFNNESKLETEFSVRQETVEGLPVMYAGDKDLFVAYRSLITTLVKYATLVSINKKPSEGDCASVAGAARKDLESTIQRFGFSSGIIGTEASGKSLPFYRELGYGHHIINYLEGDTVSLAFDVTASYTYPGTPKPSLFLVIAASEAQVRSILKTVTGSRWDVR